jgi:DNA-binding HxlR family transcriptional regulator
MSLIGTKWKPLILFHLLDVYVPLLKISGISNKMFTDRKRIGKDGLISRKFPVVPPSGIQIEGEEDLKYFTAKLDQWGLKITN